MISNRATFPRVVIIGAGFGGLSTAKQLAQAPFDVNIIHRDKDVEVAGVVWAAGVKASPVAEWLGIELLGFESVDAPGGMWR